MTMLCLLGLGGFCGWEVFPFIFIDTILFPYLFFFATCELFHLLKLRDWHFGFETSRFRNFCQIFEGFGFGKFGFGKKVSVSVSKKFGLGKKSRFRFRKNLVSEKSLGFGFGKFGLGSKVSFSVLEKFGLGKSLGFSFGKFGLGRKVSVSVSEKFGLGKKSRFRKIWYRKKSLGIGFGQNFGIVIQCSHVNVAFN